MLAKHQGWLLSLDGLDLDYKLAEILVQRKGKLSFTSFIDEKMASILVSGRCRHLGVSRMSDKAKEILVAWDGRVTNEDLKVLR